MPLTAVNLPDIPQPLGIQSTDNKTEEAIDFAELKGVNCMVEKFPLAEANKAFDHMMSGNVRFRSVLVME